MQRAATLNQVYLDGCRASLRCAAPELLSVITRNILEWLLISELPLALCRSAADLPRETIEVVLGGALVRDGGTPGPDDRSSASGTFETPETPRRAA